MEEAKGGDQRGGEGWGSGCRDEEVEGFSLKGWGVAEASLGGTTTELGAQKGGAGVGETRNRGGRGAHDERQRRLGRRPTPHEERGIGGQVLRSRSSTAEAFFGWQKTVIGADLEGSIVQTRT